MREMKRAVLGLGSNLGRRGENLSLAVQAIKRLPGTAVIGTSGLYETKPFEVSVIQNDYLNLCITVLTSLSPRALLGASLGIEAAMGRERTEYHGARIIDIDLLLYENEMASDEELTLPHPGILNRAFVLVPLNDLFPNKKALGLDFSAAYKKVDQSGVSPLISE